MSHSFRLKYDQLREGNPTAPADASDQGPEVQDESYSGTSNVRNICFVLLDGRRLFLNYAYLVSCEHLPEDNSLTLIWTTHSVILKGFSLHLLFDELMMHLSPADRLHGSALQCDRRKRSAYCE